MPLPKNPVVRPRSERADEPDPFTEDAYVGEADTWCEAHAPAGASDATGETSDTPQHCAHCGVPLKGSLTDHGVEYVLEYVEDQLAQHDGLVLPLRTQHGEGFHAHYHGKPYCAVVRDWCFHLRAGLGYALTETQEKLVGLYLERTDREIAAFGDRTKLEGRLREAVEFSGGECDFYVEENIERIVTYVGPRYAGVREDG